jgi:cell wall-associated NlpC family hydrolase
VNRKTAGSAGLGVALLLLLFILAIPMLIVGGMSMLFAGGGGSGCVGAPSQPAGQPAGSTQANSIPASYLKWYKTVGLQYNIPWTILAGIGTEESDNGQSNLPGVHSNQNGFGAAGPMQIGIEGASTNTWGGPPIHPASENFGGVATDENGDGSDNVYDPPDAIAGAAKYLNEHGFQQDPSAAIFAYNHAGWYVTAVENFASSYAAGGFTVSQVNPAPSASATGNCIGTVLDALSAPNAAVATAIKYAEEQIGKPYQFGGTGPDAFDCSGLVMMAYRAAGVGGIPRTASEQWHWGPQVAASAASPGDLVFFAGADGSPAMPGHVGLVIGKNTMIEAYATGFPVRIAHFGTADSAPGERQGQVVGFTRPWAHAGLNLPPGALATPAPSATRQPGTGSSTPAKPAQPGKPAVPTATASAGPKVGASGKS